jgi:hypothetical protein
MKMLAWGLAGIAASLATPAVASEGGKSAYPNGAEALTIAALPPPGTYLLDYQYYYTADRLNDRDGNSVGPPDLSVDAVANIPRFVHVTNTKILGATLAMQVFVPVVNVNVRAGGSRQNKFGIGDLIVNPFILGWNRKNTFFVLTMDTFVPTGRYKRTDLANIGNNYWTFEPVFAVSHFNPAGSGPEVSAKFMYDFNTKNTATQYRSGQAAHVDFAASYNFNPITVGVTGYYFKQTTDDKLNGVKVGTDGYRGEVFALGPLVRYQAGKVPIVAQWQHELSASNRTQGNSFWLKAAFRF